MSFKVVKRILAWLGLENICGYFSPKLDTIFYRSCALLPSGKRTDKGLLVTGLFVLE